MVGFLLMKLAIIYAFDSCVLANEESGGDNEAADKKAIAWVLICFSLFEFLGICFVSFKFVFQEKAHQVNQCRPTSIDEFC